MARKIRPDAGAELAQSLLSPTAPAAPTPEPSQGMFDLEIPPPEEDDGSAERARRAASAAHVNGIAPTPAALKPARVLPSGEMDFGELVYRLANVIPAVKVRIGDVSGWSLVERLQARAWLEGSGAPPEFLTKYIEHSEKYKPAPTMENSASREVERKPQAIPPPAPTESMVAPSAPKPDTDRHPPPLFATAHGKASGITPDYERIIETVYQVDVFKDYADLEANLEVGEGRNDRATLRIHLDKAQQRARRAHHLLLGAKLEFVRWEQDANKVRGAMRGEASAELEAEKAAGERKKAITNPDVEARMSEKFADEYAAQAVTRAKMEGTVDDMEHLVKRWNSKCEDLRTLLETLPR